MNTARLEFRYENIYGLEGTTLQCSDYLYFENFILLFLNVVSQFSAMCTCYFSEQKNLEEKLVTVTEGEWQSGRSGDCTLWKPRKEKFLVRKAQEF